MKHNHTHKRILMQEPRLENVAPPRLLRDDFETLDAKSTLRCSSDVEQLLLMQSVEGHAHAGHGHFYGRTYPNTTVDDVARALRLDPEAVKAERQLYIDEIFEFAERVVAGEKLTAACTPEGEPLLRCGTLRNIEIDPAGVLKGLYAGGLRDDSATREMANERYGVEMGYGECRLVDQRILRKLDLTGFDLARTANQDRLADFEKAGLFGRDGDPNIAYMYVRYKVGPGASDDAAIVMAGKLWGFSAAVGCFLADAVDTLEKYVPAYADQDSEISAFINENDKNLGLTLDDAVDLTYLCAIPFDRQGRLPDSSLRHLLQVERKHDQSTLESHLAFVAGRPYTQMELDHGECTNTEFYHYVEERLREFKPVR